MTEENAAQAAFWEGDPGQAWVRLQPELDEIHAPVLAELLARADARRGERVIDVGCGAGTSSLAFAGRVGPHGRVEGIDISGPLLERAEKLARQSGHDHLSFRHADAQDADFEPGAADLVASRFGVMFFADPVAAFANLRRALAADGRLVFAAWDEARHNPWFATPRQVAVARLGEPAPGDPDGPGPMAFRDPGRVVGLLEAAGFREAACETVDLELVLSEGAPGLRRLLPVIGPIKSVVREQGGTPEDLDALIEETIQAFAPHLGPRGLRLPARVHFFRALV
ncbi:class I SAM-dependent methyltransferase [Litorisediminicola beolgyonensis]|uniref:Class I SAM-dependent methyltransferase n=1 Tax=Litorisediminicola beolgyonensis TaxID=1173614 RepID=A0ABW3ZF28_9RHOB